MHRYGPMAWVVAVFALMGAGCHREVPEDIPSADTRKITIADRFYDVVAHARDTPARRGRRQCRCR